MKHHHTKPARTSTRILAAALLSAFFCLPAAAKNAFPDKPVRIIICTSASGGTDFAARMFGQKLSELWGQSVVMDNRPGATGMIGMEAAAHATSDGYTLLVMNVGHLITAALSEKLNFDVGRDLLPLSEIARTPILLVVNPAVKAQTIREFIALAKAQPGKLAYASGGTGGIQHLATELFKHEAGIDLLHVPYKGSGPGIIDLIGGQVQLTMTSVPALLPHVKSGKLRALAVTGAARLSATPNVPTFTEAGLPGVSAEIWYGLLAPAKIPRAVVDRIAKSVAEAAGMRDVKDRMVRSGAETVGSTPAEFGAFFRSERAKWVKVARQANIKLESSR
jgi:tripartite-type tricarboxylate transporter receptor subunit TctC